jgi:hypothetical protein
MVRRQGAAKKDAARGASEHTRENEHADCDGTYGLPPLLSHK